MILRALAMATALTFLAGGLCHASEISYQGSVTFTGVGTQNLAIQQFDPSLGNLTGVTVSVYGTGQEQYFVILNYLPGTMAIDITPHLQDVFTVIGWGVSEVETVSWSGQTVTVPNQGFASWPASETPGVGWGESLLSTTQPSAYSAYMGTGTASFTVNATTMHPFFTHGPGITDDYYQEALGRGDITEWTMGPSLNVRIVTDYQYDPAPIPEPATLALFPLGIIGLRLRGQLWRRAASTWRLPWAGRR